MENSEGTQLTCGRATCGHTWTFRGKSEFYTTCPKCKTSVRIKKIR